MDFAAFLVVNVLLFVRPQELAPDLEKVPLYYCAMLACIGSSIVPLMNLAFTKGIVRHPIVLLVLSMLVLAAVALVVNGKPEAFEEVFEYLKVITYFILFVAIVRTPQRLKGVIAVVVICMMFTASIGILHFYEVVSIPNLKQLEEGDGSRNDKGDVESLRRLRFTGVQDGPNEVAVFLAALSFLCAFQLTDSRQGAARYVWALPIALFLTCIILTRSRSGLLALLTGIVVFAVYYAGRNLASGKKPPIFQALAAAALAIPVLLVVAGGRQAEISVKAGTAKTRFENWDDWLFEFRNNPVFGVGPKLVSRARGTPGGPAAEFTPGIPVEGDKLLAHNSYLQPFADMGFLGGVAFLGIVAFAFVTMHRFGMGQTMIFDPDLARLQPFLIAALTCLAVGFMFLPLNYLLPVYFLLALPVAYYGMTPCIPPIQRPALSGAAWFWLLTGAVGFLGTMYVIVNVMKRI